jgi:hypothetical protein
MTSRVAAACLCAILAVATCARAQDQAAPSGPLTRAQVTPYVFMGSDASSGVGAAVRWPLPASFSVELETSYRRGGVASLSSYVNGLYYLPKIGGLTPYAAGGLGLDQYAGADRFGAGPLLPFAGTALAVNAGGGIHIPAGQRWGVRADVRWSNGLARRAPERLRLFTGITFGGKAR